LLGIAVDHHEAVMQFTDYQNAASVGQIAGNGATGFARLESRLLDDDPLRTLGARGAVREPVER